MKRENWNDRKARELGNWGKVLWRRINGDQEVEWKTKGCIQRNRD